MISICIKGNTIVKDNVYSVDTKMKLYEEDIPNLEIKESYVCLHHEIIEIVSNDTIVATVELGAPIMVAQAEKEEKWGYFQFPVISRNEDGFLTVKWQMNADSYSAYGKSINGLMISKDEGQTWLPTSKRYISKMRRRLETSDGYLLQERTPAAKDIHSYAVFPRPVNSNPIKGYDFYFEKDLPNDLRGVYLTTKSSDTETLTNFHAQIYDPNLLRCAQNDNLAVVWWGDIRRMKNGVLVAGVYGGFCQGEDGKVLNSPITFYRSQDGGKNWFFLSRILYRDERGNETIPFDGRDGFCEPTFEILNDGTFLCVMRSGSTKPMYRTFSKDNGKHWTIPEAFTPNGVMPQLVILGNGSLVLASGRPGMQLRFCLNGDGRKWTKPIEMLPFTDENGKYHEWWTCGYPSILLLDENSFYIVYSDFRTKNEIGEYRKGIFFRKVTLKKEIDR